MHIHSSICHASPHLIHYAFTQGIELISKTMAFLTTRFLQSVRCFVTPLASKRKIYIRVIKCGRGYFTAMTKLSAAMNAIQMELACIPLKRRRWRNSWIVSSTRKYTSAFTVAHNTISMHFGMFPLNSLPT